MTKHPVIVDLKLAIKALERGPNFFTKKEALGHISDAKEALIEDIEGHEGGNNQGQGILPIW